MASRAARAPLGRGARRARRGGGARGAVRRRAAAAAGGAPRAAEARECGGREYVLRGANRLGQNENWVSLEVLPSDALPGADASADAADEARIGSAVAWPRKSGRGSNLFVSGIKVDSEHRRRGLATWLLDAIEEEAKSRGMDGVELTVVRTNGGAIQLYEARGYADVKIGPLEVAMDPQLALSKRMVKAV